MLSLLLLQWWQAGVWVGFAGARAVRQCSHLVAMQRECVAQEMARHLPDVPAATTPCLFPRSRRTRWVGAEIWLRQNALWNARMPPVSCSAMRGGTGRRLTLRSPMPAPRPPAAGAVQGGRRAEGCAGGGRGGAAAGARVGRGAAQRALCAHQPRRPVSTASTVIPVAAGPGSCRRLAGRDEHKLVAAK